METVEVGQTPGEAVIEALLQGEWFRQLAGGYGVGCFALPGALHAAAFYKALIEHSAEIDSTTREHVAFIVFYGNRSRLVLDRVYGRHAYCTVSRIDGISTSRGTDFECVNFSDELGDEVRFRPQNIDPRKFHYAMSDCGQALLDRFQITHKVEPCLLFVDPEKPQRHTIVQLSEDAPLRSLFSDVLTPLSDAFRALSAFWNRRDDLQRRKRGYEEACATLNQSPDKISMLTADRDRLEADRLRNESTIERDRREMETIKPLLQAFKDDWRNADLRLLDMSCPDWVRKRVGECQELRQRYDEFSLKLAKVLELESTGSEERTKLYSTLLRISNKRYAKLGMLRKDISDRFRSGEQSVERLSSLINQVRSNIDWERKRIEDARCLITAYDPHREKAEETALEAHEAQLREFGYPDEIFSPRPSAFEVIETLKRTGQIGARRKPASNPEEKIRVLFLTSNPYAKARLDLEEEMRSIQNELRAVSFREKISLTVAHAVRPDDLVRLLRQERPAIVHFSGHASPEGIILRTDSGQLTVSGELLAQVFEGRGVKIVILSASITQAQALALKDVVPAVVGTVAELGDHAARRFSTAFYRTLGEGHSFKEAFRDGLDAVSIHGLKNVFQAYGDLEQSGEPI